MTAAIREPAALTIAGSDSSGGAGLQADLKTFTALGVYGASVVTALTAQNTLGVQGVVPVAASFVTLQMESVLSDLHVTAAKTGMLATKDIVAAVAARMVLLPRMPLIVDPVMVATSGDSLLDEAAIDSYRQLLLPRATLVTPNLPEAARLLGEPEAQTVEDCIRQAKAFARFGSAATLIKGGHARGAEVVDVLCDKDEIILFRHPRIDTRNTHGTGCTFSAAITARMALAVPLRAAVGDALVFLECALQSGAALAFGAGAGPVDHLAGLRYSDRTRL
jgi:hydroxymethylpyrimidine/phosphomethylpyrimidine kinase